MKSSAVVTAGPLSADERLTGVALEAWEKWPAAHSGISRRDYVIGALNGDMTWAMVQDFNASVLTHAIGALLNRTRPVVRDTGKPVGGGHFPSDTQRIAAPAVPSRDDARPQAVRRSESASIVPAPQQRAPVRSNLSLLADKHAARAVAATATAIRLSKLDVFVVNGRPIGDLTPTEANAWAGSRERDVRFVRMLTANLPPNRPIRDFVRPDEADELYQRAEMTNAA